MKRRDALTAATIGLGALAAWLLGAALACAPPPPPPKTAGDCITIVVSGIDAGAASNPGF